MTTKLARFTQKAREELRLQFISLTGLLFDPVQDRLSQILQAIWEPEFRVFLKRTQGHAE